MGCIGVMKDIVPMGDKGEKWLSSATWACDRAKELVRRFQDFCRPAADDPSRRFVVNPILKEIAKFFLAVAPSGIKVDLKLGSDEYWLKGDPGRFHQVMMNLCSNALHAMEARGGKLSIQAVREAGPLPPQERGAGSFFRIEVRDTGCGMDSQVLSRVFDPYFTTKAKSVGTGLGMAVAYTAIEDMGGDIYGKSIPGKGTTFILRLPESLPDAVRQSSAPRPLIRGSERILMVEDNALLVTAGEETLAGLGYQVKGLRDPKKALSIFAEQPDQFDLVITDYRMPRMAGDEFVAAIRTIRPDIQVVISSGFVGRFQEELGPACRIQAFIQKPYDSSQLGRVVRSVLDESIKNEQN